MTDKLKVLLITQRDKLRLNIDILQKVNSEIKDEVLGNRMRHLIDSYNDVNCEIIRLIYD